MDRKLGANTWGVCLTFWSREQIFRRCVIFLAPRANIWKEGPIFSCREQIFQSGGVYDFWRREQIFGSELPDTIHQRYAVNQVSAGETRKAHRRPGNSKVAAWMKSTEFHHNFIFSDQNSWILKFGNVWPVFHTNCQGGPGKVPRGSWGYCGIL